MLILSLEPPSIWMERERERERERKRERERERVRLGEKCHFLPLSSFLSTGEGNDPFFLPCMLQQRLLCKCGKNEEWKDQTNEGRAWGEVSSLAKLFSFRGKGLWIRRNKSSSTLFNFVHGFLLEKRHFPFFQLTPKPLYLALPGIIMAKSLRFPSFFLSLFLSVRTRTFNPHEANNSFFFFAVRICAEYGLPAPTRSLMQPRRKREEPKVPRAQTLTRTHAHGANRKRTMEGRKKEPHSLSSVH